MDAPDVQRFVAEFNDHPSFRPVASFFLGFVFISCVHFSWHVPIAAIRHVRSRLLGAKRVRQMGGGLETNNPYGDEKVQGWLGFSRGDHASSISSTPKSNNLALALTVCVAMGSLAQFGSLLVFGNTALDQGQAGCAFLVAWGGLATQAARLLGLLKLSLDLRKMGVHKWETFMFWGWLAFGLVLMFVSNALSVGSTRQIPQMPNSALCFRKHFLPTAVISAAIDLILEVYSLARIYYLLVPSFLSASHKLDAILDVRTSRALSLLVLDLTAVVPTAKFFSVLTDVLPASIATLLVLAAFNQRSPDVSLATTASIPVTRAGSFQSRSTIEIKKMPSVHSLADPDSRISHPFAARALQDPSPETEDWPESASPAIPEKPYLSYPVPARTGGSRKTWRASAQSGVSESDSDIARSVKGAVVSFAFKDHVGQSRAKPRERERSFLPRMPSTSEEGSLRGRAARSQGDTLPSTAPLRIPKPFIPPALDVADIERASHDLASSSAPQPQISVTKATPVASAVLQQAEGLPASAPAPAGKRPSVTITLPSSYSESSKSLHLTPSTPARSHLSRSLRASAESNLTGEWRYDSRHDSLSSSHGPSGSDEDAVASRHQSGPLPPADDDLSVVYEASHEDSESIPPSRTYRPTFGEHMFVQGGLGGQVYPPADVPQDVRPEENSNGSTKSASSGGRN